MVGSLSVLFISLLMYTGFEHQLFVPEDLSDPSAASTAQQDFARVSSNRRQKPSQYL